MKYRVLAEPEFVFPSKAQAPKTVDAERIAIGPEHDPGELSRFYVICGYLSAAEVGDQKLVTEGPEISGGKCQALWAVQPRPCFKCST